jgi:hypothetical protein
MYSVLVGPAEKSLLEDVDVQEIDAPGYAAIAPTVSPRPTYPSLVTEPPLLPQYAVYQDVYGWQYCTIGSVRDGETVELLPESAAALDCISQQAQSSIEQSYNLAGEETRMQLRQNLPCGCCQHHETRRVYKEVAYANLDDIVFDFSRSAQEFFSRQGSTPLLTLYQELHRTLEIVNLFITWLMRKFPNRR